MTTPKLSKYAEKLLARLQAGVYYSTISRRTPKAMQELIKVGLVEECTRPVIFLRCYVPARSYTPYAPEIFHEPEPR